ncbi:hypothetical protein V8E55_002414 [Tylopilus felleus]
MAEPSYYPLSPVRKYPLEGTTSPSLDHPLREDAYPVHSDDKPQASDPPGSRSSVFLAPLRCQQSRRGPSVGPPHLWRTIETPLKMALLPLAAIGYLAFCYTVHGKPVPVNTYGFYAVTTQHLATIKGGITSISIIIISIALYPVYDIVAKVKSEEFFRALASHSHGVPLETINHVSTPSFGHIDMMMAMWRHRCSKYYILGIVTSLLIWIAGTLAPGALTIDSVLADGELMAFAIGAVPAQSVFNGTNYSNPAQNAVSNAPTAASITWAERELGVQYSFGVANTSGPDYTAYIVPIPLNLSTTTSARWLSDVIGINPMCSWSSTNLTTPVQLSGNLTLNPGTVATAYLPEFDLDVLVDSIDLISSPYFAQLQDPTIGPVVNHTTGSLPSNGVTVFLLGQCQGLGCPVPIGSNFTVDFIIDLTGISTTFTIAFTDQTWSLAILACNPNITIETREVQNEGYGLLSVQALPAGAQLSRQGNLNPIQTTALLSIVATSLWSNTGSLISVPNHNPDLGSQVLGEVLFGKAQYDNLPGPDSAPGETVTVTPAPIANITQGYIQILQSTAKPYLAGYLGAAYVPGRVSDTELVFAASIPNLAVSTAVFALLTALIVLAHLRSGKGIEFTLVNVAAAVHGSELPAQFARLKAEHTGNGHEDADIEVGDPDTDDSMRQGEMCRVEVNSPENQEDIVRMLGERQIFMQRRADGSLVLHIS